MKPAYEKLAASAEDGIHCNVFRGNSFGCVWHCHVEYEITLVLKARGHRLVGDNLASLKPGDMVLVGSNLPHDWQNDTGAPGGVQPVHSICIHFHPDWLGRGWLDLPAMQQVKRLLERSDHTGMIRVTDGPARAEHETDPPWSGFVRRAHTTPSATRVPRE